MYFTAVTISMMPVLLTEQNSIDKFNFCLINSNIFDNSNVYMLDSFYTGKYDSLYFI